MNVEIVTSSAAIESYSPSVEMILDGYIEQWLEDVFTAGSKSERTRNDYRARMAEYRARLQDEGLDLVSENHERLAAIAKEWAAHRSPRSKRAGQPVAESTYDLRLATVSSFYTWIQEKQRLDGKPEYPNPIARVKRPRIQAYANAASPLEAEDVADALNSIDRSTPRGKLKYAILALALATGRRANELITLRARHIAILRGGILRVTFEHCKGGKKMIDRLDADTSLVILQYLKSVYGENLKGFTEDAPVWVSFSNRTKGQALSVHTLYDICEDVLGDSRIHITRHTFARNGEEEGATASDMQHRLGHATLNQTGTYLKALRSDLNPVASKLSKRFNIKPLGQE